MVAVALFEIDLEKLDGIVVVVVVEASSRHGGTCLNSLRSEIT